MGKLFDRTNLKVPNGCSNFGLLELDQMESSTSGGTEEDDDDEEENNGLEISPWIPSKKIAFCKTSNGQTLKKAGIHFEKLNSKRISNKDPI